MITCSDNMGAHKRQFGLNKKDVCKNAKEALKFFYNLQGPPKKFIHTLTKENSMLYKQLL
jgi:hypothetical protein